jgi:hypothetical protein
MLSTPADTPAFCFYPHHPCYLLLAALQIGQEIQMALLNCGVDSSGFGLSQGALLPLCTSQVDDCARFVYQHGGTSLQELMDTNALSLGERRTFMPWVAANMVATLAELEAKVSPSLLHSPSTHPVLHRPSTACCVLQSAIVPWLQMHGHHSLCLHASSLQEPLVS